MTNLASRPRPERSILLAALALLTLTSSGCATLIGGELIEGEPPRAPPLDAATPVQRVDVAPAGSGEDAVLRLHLGHDDGSITQRDVVLAGAGGRRVVVQLGGGEPQLGRQARRVSASGRLGLAAPLEAEELETDVIAVVSAARDRVLLFVPPDANAPRQELDLSFAREQPLRGLRAGLRLLLTPALVAIDVVTFPVQALVVLSLGGPNFRLGC